METGVRWGYGYKYLGEDSAVEGLDVMADEGDIKTDDARMTIEYPFAASHGRDRIGDFLRVDGIRTEKHEGNPMAFTDHGKKLWMPLGLDQDPDGKQYTVRIDVDRGMAFAKTFVSDICKENLQIYEMYKRGILRSGSIGYRPVEWSDIPPDRAEGLPKGRDLRVVELLETSAVFLPCNQDCSRVMLNEPWAGKSLSDSLRAQAEQWRPRGKPFADPRELRAGLANIEPLVNVQVWERKSLPTAKTKGIKDMTAMSAAAPATPAMSATDQTGGGALVPPKRGRAMEEETPIPSNAQHMANTHAILSAGLEHLDKGADLVDHPAIQKHYAKIKTGLEKARNETNELWKATYPQFEALHEDKKAADEVVEGEPGEEEVIADTSADPDEAETPEPETAKKPKPPEEEEEETPAGEGKGWRAPIYKRVGQTKGLEPGTNEVGRSTDALAPCIKGCKDIGAHLKEASEAEDLPEEHKKTCYHYGMKMDELTGTGEQAGGGDMPGHDPELDKLQSHLGDVNAHLMKASTHQDVPPEWQKKHYHYGMKAEEIGRDLQDLPKQEEEELAPESAADESDAGLDEEGKSLILNMLREVHKENKSDIAGLEQKIQKAVRK
jgi:hypothetical protein